MLLQYGLGAALMVVFAYMSANYPEHTGLFFTLYFVVFLGVLLLLTGRQARGILRDIEQVSRGEVIYEAPSAEVVKLREKDGREVLFMGGIDKHALIESPKAINRGLERVKPLVEEGG